MISKWTWVALLCISTQSLTLANQDSLAQWKSQAIIHMNDFAWQALNPLIEKMKTLELPNHAQEQYINLYLSHNLKRSFPDSARVLATESLNFFLQEKNPDVYHIFYSYLALGNAYSNLGDQHEAILWYGKAKQYLSRSEANQYEELDLRLLYIEALAHLKIGDLTQATKTFWNAREQASSLGDSLFLGNILTQIGNIHIRREDYSTAIKLNREALQILNDVGSPSLVYALGALGSAFTETNQLDSAKVYLEHVVFIRRKGNNTLSLGVSLVNLSELYRKLGMYAKSNEISQEVLQLGRESGINSLKINARINLCLCKNNKREYTDAIQEAHLGINLLGERPEFALARDLYACASKAHELSGQMGKALEYYKLKQIYSDSLVNSESEKTLQELQTKYQSIEQQARISQLEGEATFEALRNRQVKIILIGIMGILGLVGGTSYLNTRRKFLQTEKNRIELEQKLLRFQMNPHFIFNAISSIQNFLFDKRDLKIALHYFSQFADLMRQTLEHCRESYISLSKELEALENYLSLQQLRYQNAFDYEITMDPNIVPEDLLIPPLIAQPFVENAIEHGKIYQVENGKVTIEIKKFNEGITLLIKDNGLGLSSIEVAQHKKEKTKQSLATIITRERLDAWSKQHRLKFKLLVEEIQPAGTLITIEIPVL